LRRAVVHAAERAPEEVDIWFTTRTSLDEDQDKAIENVKASVSSILNHSMRFGLEGKHVPDERLLGEQIMARFV